MQDTQLVVHFGFERNIKKRSWNTKRSDHNWKRVYYTTRSQNLWIKGFDSVSADVKWAYRKDQHCSTLTCLMLLLRKYSLIPFEWYTHKMRPSYVPPRHSYYQFFGKIPSVSWFSSSCLTLTQKQNTLYFINDSHFQSDWKQACHSNWTMHSDSTVRLPPNKTTPSFCFLAQMWFVDFVLEALSTAETVWVQPCRAKPGRAGPGQAGHQACLLRSKPPSVSAESFPREDSKGIPSCASAVRLPVLRPVVYNFAFNCLHLTWFELDYERLCSVKSHSSCQGSTLLLWSACETLFPVFSLFSLF